MEQIAQHLDYNKYLNIKAPEFKSYRDELVSKFTNGINTSRLNTSYKPISKRTVAIRINLNPKLARDNGEIELLYKECVAAGNFKKFFWATMTGKKLSTSIELGKKDKMGL